MNGKFKGQQEEAASLEYRMKHLNAFQADSQLTGFEADGRVGSTAKCNYAYAVVTDGRKAQGGGRHCLLDTGYCQLTL